jgi:hypothetical protein
VLESLRLYLTTFTLANVIQEVQGWLARGRSCFEELLEKFGLSLPAQSILDEVLPSPSGEHTRVSSTANGPSFGRRLRPSRSRARSLSKAQSPMALRLASTFNRCYVGTPLCAQICQLQTGEGGATFCPLGRDARMALTSTPRLATQIRRQYGEGPADRVARDLTLNHGRPVAAPFAQDTAAAVAAVAQAEEEQWHHATPKLTRPVQTIGVGVEGTCLLVVADGERQALVGTISL